MSKFLLFLSFFLFMKPSWGYLYQVPGSDMLYGPKVLEVFDFLVERPKASLTIDTDDYTEKFFNSTDIEKYFRLKIRNFVNEFSFNGDEKSDHFAVLSVKLEKYNDNLSIQYGVVKYTVYTGRNKPNANNLIGTYSLTIPIANTSSEIKKTIKDRIDLIVEKFATDFYKLKDAISEKN